MVGGRGATQHRGFGNCNLIEANIRHELLLLPFNPKRLRRDVIRINGLKIEIQYVLSNKNLYFGYVYKKGAKDLF